MFPALSQSGSLDEQWTWHKKKKDWQRVHAGSGSHPADAWAKARGSVLG